MYTVTHYTDLAQANDEMASELLRMGRRQAAVNAKLQAKKMHGYAEALDEGRLGWKITMRFYGGIEDQTYLSVDPAENSWEIVSEVEEQVHGHCRDYTVSEVVLH